MREKKQSIFIFLNFFAGLAPFPSTEEFEMEENETLGRVEEGFRGTSLLGSGNGHGIA